MHKAIRTLTAVLSAALSVVFVANASATLRVAYSDWPGWVAWDIGVQKGWFEEAGVDIDFIWFDYVASMDAFAAGQVDAVTITNGDALVTGATGTRIVMIGINDYSDGNDKLVARRGINSVSELKGKKVGVEVGFVGHLLLLNALESADLRESDVEIINIATDQTAQALATGDVDAIVAWQPHSGQALSSVSGSTELFTSADVPGIIYDTLGVSPRSLAQNRAEWEKVLQVWYRIVDYINDPDTRPDAISIMSDRVNVSPGEYAEFLSGTRLLTLPEAQAAAQRGEGLDSIFGSTKIVDAFNVDNDVYHQPQRINAYFNFSILEGLEP